MELTVQNLAAVLAQEFSTWGDLDPAWFQSLAKEELVDPEDDDYESIQALREVLEKVILNVFMVQPFPPAEKERHRELGIRLLAAYMSQQLGVSYDTALKRHVKPTLEREELGDYWYCHVRMGTCHGARLRFIEVARTRAF